MKIKSLFLSAGALVLAVSFSFCTKDEQTAPTPEKPTEAAVDRGICETKITAWGGTVDVCGVQNNLNICSTVGGISLFGNDFVANGAQKSYTLTTPAQLSFSRNPFLPSAANVVVLVSTNSGFFKYEVPATGSVVATIDDFCVPN